MTVESLIEKLQDIVRNYGKFYGNCTIGIHLGKCTQSTEDLDFDFDIEMRDMFDPDFGDVQCVVIHKKGQGTKLATI